MVLNCPDWFQEAERILDMGFAEYEYFTAFAAGESVRVLPVQDGVRETVSIVTQRELGAPVRKGLVPTLEYTLPDELPAGFQRSEFQLEHGFVDQVVPRDQLRDTLIRVLQLHVGGKHE